MQIVNAPAEQNESILRPALSCTFGSVVRIRVKEAIMTRVPILRTGLPEDPMVEAIFKWVIAMEGKVPNHFLVELNFPEFMKAKLSATKLLWEAGELSLPEVLHVGIAVSQANRCHYCTGAFCTVLNHGLREEESHIVDFLHRGPAALDDQRMSTIVDFAMKLNISPHVITDMDVKRLRGLGLGDRGIVQLVHLVSDFASYNALNTALQTEYDYRDIWRQAAFGTKHSRKESPGGITRAVRRGGRAASRMGSAPSG